VSFRQEKRRRSGETAGVTIGQIKVLCGVVLLLGILLSGCATAFVVYSVTTPPPPGSFVIDYFFEINLMTFVLNLVLPVCILAYIAWIFLKRGEGKFRWFGLAARSVGLIAVLVCALAMWNGLAAMHGPAPDLWKQIWWSF
jgi:hypothetical protein